MHFHSLLLSSHLSKYVTCTYCAAYLVLRFHTFYLPLLLGLNIFHFHPATSLSPAHTWFPGSASFTCIRCFACKCYLHFCTRGAVQHLALPLLHALLAQLVNFFHVHTWCCSSTSFTRTFPCFCWWLGFNFFHMRLVIHTDMHLHSQCLILRCHKSEVNRSQSNSRSQSPSLPAPW